MCMEHTVPSVQAVGVYPYPPERWLQVKLHRDPELIQETELTTALEAQSETWTFTLPDHEIGRRSAYYHTATETATTCTAAQQAFIQVLGDRVEKELRDRAERQLGNPSADTECPREVMADEKRTASTIFAMKPRLPQNGLESTGSSDMSIGSRIQRETFPISFDVAADIQWLDCPFQAGYEWIMHGEGRDPLDGGDDASYKLTYGLRMAGFYSGHLVSLQRLAVEFDEAQFRRVCFWCEMINMGRSRYLDWLQLSREATSPEAQATNQVCLLCSTLKRPDFAHLSTAEKQQIRDWLKYSKLRELVEAFQDGRDPIYVQTMSYDAGAHWETNHEPITRETVTWDNVERYWPSAERLDPFDLEAFREAFPIVEKVYDELLGAASNHDHPLYACLGDFNGDTLAFYNNVWASWSDFGERPYTSYISWKYDEAAGAPICFAGEKNARRHRRDWCKEVGAVAQLWPLTTPNLRTVYVIDRGIKLRPGANIPQEMETFQGNGCVYVEVPEPTDPSLETGGADGVWQYPRGGHPDTNVFSLVRYLRGKMERANDRNQRRGWDHSGRGYFQSSDRLIEACTARGVDSPQRRAIEAGILPAVKVLAIVE